MKVRSKMIAGVSINLDNPPAYDVIMGMALKSKDYYKKPEKEARKLIAKELRDNGIKRVRKSSKKKQEGKQESDR